MEPNRGSAQASHDGNNDGDSLPQTAYSDEESTDRDSRGSSNEVTLNVKASPSSGMPIALLAMPSSSKEHSTKSARRSNIAPSYREVRVLNPSPYFYYIDHSRGSDDDPLAPLSPALSVPNFVIKLHAILICESLSNIISWMPHGRSWKILNQVRRVLLSCCCTVSIIPLTLNFSHPQCCLDWIWETGTSNLFQSREYI